MLAIAAPHGATIQIPSVLAEDNGRYPPASDAAAVRDYYDANGYVVVRDLISSADCERLRSAFEAEVRPHRGFIYRQASATPERHVFSQAGHMVNSLLNPHCVDPRKFPRFRQLAVELITAAALQNAVRAVLGEHGTVVQSMYFEGNPATWAHQDTYYLDSERLGSMAAVWIALEDISPGAGRFYIYPGSHKIELAANRAGFNIASNHPAYKQLVLETIARHRLECRAPALRKGDVLFWNARTMHGSLETSEPHFSRSSVTAHYIPSSTRFMQFQTRVRRLALTQVNGMQVHAPKDLRKYSSRAVMYVESHYPRAFNAAKRAAIRVVTR